MNCLRTVVYEALALLDLKVFGNRKSHDLEFYPLLIHVTRVLTSLRTLNEVLRKFSPFNALQLIHMFLPGISVYTFDKNRSVTC